MLLSFAVSYFKIFVLVSVSCFVELSFVFAVSFSLSKMLFSLDPWLVPVNFG